MTKIEWADETWNILTGCTRVSPGCENCYAERLAATRMKNHPRYHGVAKMTPAGPRFTGEVREHHQLLEVPLRWRKPRMIFVSAQSDLFHPLVPAEFIAKVFATMAEARQHRFQVLTKRPERAADLLNDPPGGTTWPLPNVWIGTSVEDQQRADERIPHLLNCPAAVRFVSAEPLLGPVELDMMVMPRDHPIGEGFPGTLNALTGLWVPAVGNVDEEWDNAQDHHPSIDWVIVGGESGPGARPMYLNWARSIVEQCRDAETACFVKQLGACAIVGDRPNGNELPLSHPKGGDPNEWPDDLRTREFPKEGMWR